MSKYYVHATLGDDSGLGTISDPWKTIDKVNGSSFSAGDSIYFRKGELWREQLVIPLSGESGQFVTFAAYGSGNLPVISGFVVVTGWTSANGSYQASVSTEPKVVAYNGTLLTLNDGAGSGVGLNEWDWDSNILYVNVGEDPDIGTLESGYLSYCIYADRKNYIALQDIELRGSNSYALYYVANSSSLHDDIIQGVTVSDAYAGLSIAGTGVTGNISLLLNTIHHLNEYGVHINAPSATGNLIGGNIIYDVGYTQIGADTNMQGIYCKNAGTTIESNVIYDIGNAAAINDGAGEHCVYFVGSGHLIRYNNFKNASGYGVKTGGATSCSVYYNLSWNHNGTYGGGSQIDNQGTPASLTYYNNVFYNNKKGFYIQGGNAPNLITLKNNVLFGTNGGNAIRVTNTDTTNFVSDYNIIYDSTSPSTIVHFLGTDYSFADWKTFGQDTHSTGSDPLMVNPASGDFRLKVNSLGIKAGIDVGLTKDFLGRTVTDPPDVGAYKFPHVEENVAGCLWFGARYSQ